MSADTRLTVHADHIAIVIKVDVLWTKLSIEARLHLHKRITEFKHELEEIESHE